MPPAGQPCNPTILPRQIRSRRSGGIVRPRIADTLLQSSTSDWPIFAAPVFPKTYPKPSVGYARPPAMERCLPKTCSPLPMRKAEEFLRISRPPPSGTGGLWPMVLRMRSEAWLSSMQSPTKNRTAILRQLLRKPHPRLRSDPQWRLAESTISTTSCSVKEKAAGSGPYLQAIEQARHTKKAAPLGAASTHVAL
jgi:hypothetical protein